MLVESAIESAKKSQDSRRYTECIRLANTYGSPFARKVDNYSVNGKSCPDEIIEINKQTLVARLVLGDICYRNKQKPSQIKVSWKPFVPNEKNESPMNFYCGGIVSGGKYDFLIGLLNEKPREPSEDEIIFVDKIIHELGQRYRFKQSLWYRLISKFNHHNDK
jgi:hypothetical protein